MPSTVQLSFASLLKTLAQVQFRLESNVSPNVMVAARTLREFKRQELPPYCSATPRKLLGPREPALGRLPEGSVRLELAHWPKDGLLEGALPSLFFVISGHADIRIANYVVHCQPGAMLFVPGGIPKIDASRPHYETITPEAHCDLLMINPGLVNGEGLECSICHSHADRHERGDKDEACWVKNHLLSQLFAGFASEVENEGNAKSTFYLLNGLLVLLHREIERGGGYRSWHYLDELAPSSNYDPIEQALGYINDHLGTALSIDSVARQVGFSRRAFTERFREKTGQSFKAYVTRLRLEHATTLLCEANLPVNRVSRMVGLSSGQLRYLFHEQHQCTPGEYRAKKKCLY